MAVNSPSVINKQNNLVVAFKHQSFGRVSTLGVWQKMVKRSLDIVTALAGLIILSPLFIYVAIRIKLDSKGSIFYLQERIGFNGIPFIILKFRSMFEDSEKDGPTLSCSNDVRVTKWGSVIRKWKLDELPQLLNVLIGDMSLVGPRPERKFYIDQVAAINPFFNYLHQVKPGLTSLGMIRFGYAQNVQQIVRRMSYDISYIDNYSLWLDFQILCYTLPSILEGKVFTTSVKFKTRLQRIKLTTLN